MAYNLDTVAAVAIELISMQHPIKVPWEHKLATQRNKWDTMFKLDWQLVCGRYEVEELSHYKVITPAEPKDPRHKLFLVMKHPDKIMYKGAWGPEILYYDKEDDFLRGQLGHVWATEKRGEEIAVWLRDQMFNVAPGND